MTIVTRKYIRKPLYVDAVQITVENFEELADWCQGEIRNNDGSPVARVHKVIPSRQHIFVRVHSPRTPRQTKGFVGDWLLYTEQGYKIYSPMSFKGSFEPVE